MTIVRRFLLAPSFARLIRKERGSQRVTEGYFATQSGRNSHVLVENGQCHLVLVGPEESADASFDRRTIALEGVPAVEEVPLSNASLEALLDTIEDRVGRARFSAPAAPAPRRATNDSSVIDALRRLASPHQ